MENQTNIIIYKTEDDKSKFNGMTAAEIIMKRADKNAPNMALTSWKGYIVRKERYLYCEKLFNSR